MEAPADQFAAVWTACAVISIGEYVFDDRFCSAKTTSYLAVPQTTRGEEHRLELHWLQQICQGERVDEFLGHFLTSRPKYRLRLVLLSLSQSNVAEGGQSLLEAQTRVPSFCVRDDSPVALRVVGVKSPFHSLTRRVQFGTKRQV